MEWNGTERNGLDWTRLEFQSYCETLHIKAAITLHLFKGNALLVRARLWAWLHARHETGWPRAGQRNLHKKEEHVRISHDMRDHIGLVTLTHAFV